ncbi:MAG: hypothetical protein HYS13_22165 [Planctomycetia bacterium]|nr:hypothetical protein [Planctomycetia bacterium]
MIRIQKKIESETLHIPELQPLIGKTVEIIVVEEAAPPGAPAGPPYAAFFALAGQDAVDPEAYQRLRAASQV